MAENTNVGAFTGNMARPNFITHDDTGREHITKDDIQIPRLGLAQQMSPQLDSTKPEYMENLKVGQFFNNLTKEVLEPAKGPLYFHVLRAEPPRYIEFNPRDQGGGIRDMDVPANDPRTRFTRDGNGKSVNPVATKFYDFIIVMLPVDKEQPFKSMIAFSLKSTGLKVARQLNGLIQMRDAPVFAGRYKLTSGMQTNQKGTFAVFQVENAGWAESKEEYDQLEKMHNELKGKNVTFERQPGDDDPDFQGDPTTEATQGGAPTM